MRAQKKRKRRNRRFAIALSLLVVAALIVVVVYVATLPPPGSQLDSMVNQPVSSSDLAGLQAASIQPYGPGPTSAMASTVQKYSGTPWTAGGKPVVLYVGGEFCKYCAFQRWALVLALSRFGEFSGLRYMTSASNEGDLPTFTFVGSSYSSAYIAFRPFELEDRSDTPKPLQTLPSNYSAVWTQYGGGGRPFLDFGNTYALAGSLLSDPSILQGKNWTGIIDSVITSDSGGAQIRAAANMISAVICKVTQGSPASVCGADPIGPASSGLAGPVGEAQAIQGSACQAAPVRNRVIHGAS